MISVAAFWHWRSVARAVAKFLGVADAEYARAEHSGVATLVTDRFAPRSAIRLHYREGDHSPDLLSQENIFRYYSLRLGIEGIRSDGTMIQHLVNALFLVYDRPITHGSIRVRAGRHVIHYEVKDFGARHAVICFDDIKTDMVLDVETY